MKLRMTIILLLCNAALFGQKWAPKGDQLKTEWAEKVTPANVWQEYPRPQFERQNWLNLNGLWKYSVIKNNQPQPKQFQGDILVPFCVESSLSGVAKDVKPDDRIWYKRQFEVPADWNGKNVILNFEAVDYSTTVWVNGVIIGSHKGGYDRFSFDITPYLNKKGLQELVVSVVDPTSDGSQPRGKQQLSQQGIWYTPVSGIWQTVWLEAVSTEAYLQEVEITPDIDAKTVSIIPMLNKALDPKYKVKIAILSDGKEVATSVVTADQEAVIDIKNPELWSPDRPKLYDVSLQLVNASGETIDNVNSYFGMRKISLGTQMVVNPYF